MNDTQNNVFTRLAGSPYVRRVLFDAAQAARTGSPAAAMTHAWLFTGPPGSGRSVAARAFAAALVCENPDVIGCGECVDCRTALAGTHGDIIHVATEELSISVKLIREVIAEAAKLPTTAPWRVVIIEDADRLSDGAANAFLKTVEEPPAQTVIIMCAPSTDPQDISITLRSRCRHVYIPTPPISEVARLLESEGIPSAHASLAAAASAGHIGRARHLARFEEAQKRRASVLNLAALIYRGDLAFRETNVLVKTIEEEGKNTLAGLEQKELETLQNALGIGAKGKGAAKALRGTKKILDELEEKQKKRRTRFLRDAIDLALVDLAGLYRDALINQANSGVDVIHPDFQKLSQELAEKNSPSDLVACLDAINQCRKAIGQNVRPIVALDAMVGRIRLACRAS
ncbi:DNA polymerase III subunit delta' [Corynebacterium freiburgense]|uniref:DNA polymerase III subunit delta' n=1 Tax=Corynebacterium freiburgense TaxID=556548 RepID=UPI00047DB54A|nr:DNA polymerase III subunit delta' [Corynebacterium freiburgense]WJZ01494.1 DNA polymerase III subunit tau [Corynebacterium freiburgense]